MESQVKIQKAKEVISTLQKIELKSASHVQMVLSDAHGIILGLDVVRQLIKAA